MKYTFYRYGPHPSEFMHVYMPATVTANTKIFFLIHGGFWKKKYLLKLMKKLCEFLCSLGYIVINIEYPRVGQKGNLSAKSIVKSVYAAYNYVASIPGITREMERYVVGHSVGGQLALLLGTPDAMDYYLSVSTTYIMPTHIIALSAVTDLWSGYIDLLSSENDAILRYVRLGHTKPITREHFEHFSPINYRPECKILLLHGEKDADVPCQYSSAYAEKWQSTGLVQFEKVKDGHLRMILPGNTFWKKKIWQFIPA